MRNQEEIGHRVSKEAPCDYTVEEHGRRKMARKNYAGSRFPCQGHREQGCQWII